MNENDFDLAARAWLDDGPTRMSDRAVLSTLEEIHTTRQRRAIRPAWRATPVSTFARVATAAVLVVAVGLVAINAIPRQPDGSSAGGPGTPSLTAGPATPSPTADRATPSPSSMPPVQAGDFPGLTTTFVSPRNGFSVRHPDGAAITPAEQAWGFSEQVDDGFDVVETGSGAVFKGASTNSGYSGDDSFDEEVDEWLSDDRVLPGGCGVPRSQQAEITIDGQPSRIAECADRLEATVVAGGWLYLFTLEHDRSDARAVFDALAATIDLTPETAIDFPGLTSTFVSPTYGYAFGYLDRGGLTPATELWDPVDQPLEDLNADAQFDTVETGLGAFFAAASVELPDGVSLNSWVDAYVTPGCGVYRSLQAEITIDGQPGKTARCHNGIQATVVADGRLYVFILQAARSDARAFFDAWIATIDLRPEDAAVPSSAPAS